MRQSLFTIFVAFLTGLAGSIVGNRLYLSTPAFAQADAGPKVMRVERLELMDRAGLVRAVLDASENQLPRLEFKDQSGGKERSLVLNPSMVQMKLGDQSATFSTMGAMFFAGKNAIALDMDTVGFGDPRLMISSASGVSSVRSFGRNR